MERRHFIHALGLGIAATVVPGCRPKRDSSETVSEQGDIPFDKMTCRTDIHTGAKISLLGFGCMRFPFLPPGTVPQGENRIDQDAVNEMFDYAIAHGVNYFDTSPRYCQGMSEHAVGLGLEKHDRSKIYIATKMSNFAPDLWPLEKSKAMYYNSLKELKTDYFDYYLLHNLGNLTAYNNRFVHNGLLDFLLREKEAGRIRNLGWSFHGEQEFFDYMITNNPSACDFVQIQMNYMDWKHASGANVNAEYLYGELEKRNIPVVIMEPLLGGRLAMVDYESQQQLRQASPQRSIASWAFRFAGSFPTVLTVLSGMTKLEYLQDNLRTFCPLEPITEADREMLEQTALKMLEYQYINCTDCKYCMPCPYGVDIPSIFLYYNKRLNEGKFPQDEHAPGYRQARREYLIGYDRAVPKLRQADRCIACKLCHPECPQYIRISDTMIKIDKYVEQLRQNE